MIERAHGLIVRTRPFTETSLIVHWLTPEFGRIATVAKGARRPKSPFRGKLDLFYRADFTFTRSRRSELHTLREVGLLETLPALRRELEYLEQASHCATLIERTTETETPIPAIFELFSGFLGALTKHPAQAWSVFAFQLKLLNELGLAPDISETTLSPGAKAAARLLAGADWEQISRLKLSPAQQGELQRFLHGFLIYHVGGK